MRQLVLLLVAVAVDATSRPRLRGGQAAVVHQPEPLLDGGDDRFVLFPIKHKAIWDMYKKHEASFWTTEEIDLASDKADWERLTDNERHFIANVLAFFAASDGIIVENLAQRFCSDVTVPEARCFYGFQMAMENIHSETCAAYRDCLHWWRWWPHASHPQSTPPRPPPHPLNPEQRRATHQTKPRCRPGRSCTRSQGSRGRRPPPPTR